MNEEEKGEKWKKQEEIQNQTGLNRHHSVTSKI